MKVAENLSSFLAAEPENSIAKRVLVKFLPGGTLAAMAAFALASMAVEWDVPVMQAAVPWILKATEYTGVNPIDGLITSNILYLGERTAMSIIEIMLKPLLEAQLKKGEAIGEERGRSEGEAIGREEGEAIGMERGEAIGREEGEAIGMERGEAAAEARFQQWKERQIAQGVVFADDDEEEQAENSAQ